MRGSTDPTPHTPKTAIIVDAANGKTLADLERSAREYRAEGYDVFIATNPSTGHACLWRNA